MRVSEPGVSEAAFSGRGLPRTDKDEEGEVIRERERGNPTGGVYETAETTVSGTDWTEQEKGDPERVRRNLAKGVFVTSEPTVSSEATVSRRVWTESPVVARRARDSRYEEEHEAFLCASGGGGRGATGDKKSLPGMPRPAWESFREREACLTPMKVGGKGLYTSAPDTLQHSCVLRIFCRPCSIYCILRCSLAAMLRASIVSRLR